jgi:Biotin carboxylase, N-terminal domain
LDKYILTLRRFAMLRQGLFLQNAARRLVSPRWTAGTISSSRPLFFHTSFHTPDELQHPDSPTWLDGAPFGRLLAANRGEIATRINRAASELGISTAGIYSYEGTQ